MTPARFAEFVWIWNERQALATPALHLRMARWLGARWRARDRELLLLAFGSSGKSTLVGLFCAWLLSRRPELRILVLSAEQALARKMVRNVKRIVERHPLALGLKPARADEWASDQFTVARDSELRDPSVLARGIGANITGCRADLVICDDVEVPNTCDTAPKRADLRERLAEIDYVLVPGGTQLYIGTPHSYYTVYADAPRPELGEAAPFLAGFKRLELPLLDGRGRSTWPERFTPQKVASIRRRTGPAKFASQLLLRPTSLAGGRLDPDRLRLYEAELDYREANREAALFLAGRRLVSASAWWDPAFADGAGDASVVAAVYTDEQGDYWLHRVRYLDRADAGAGDPATRQCRAVANLAADLHLPAVHVETNGIGRFLPGLLARALAEAGTPCAVRAVASRGRRTCASPRRSRRRWPRAPCMPTAACGTRRSSPRCATGAPVPAAPTTASMPWPARWRRSPCACRACRGRRPTPTGVPAAAASRPRPTSPTDVPPAAVVTAATWE